jgi:hypothetical protein
MIRNKKAIKVKYELGQNIKNDPEKNLFNILLKKHYDVTITDKDPDFIFYSFVDASGIRKVIPRGSSLRKVLGFFRQNLGRIPRFDEFLYDLLHEKPQMPVLKTNATRIFYTSVNCRPEMNKCDWAFTFDYDDFVNNPRHLRLPYYKFEGGAGDNLIKEIDFEKIKKEKTKFCAFIYSNSVPFRENFFKRLSKYKKIDAPGTSMQNMPILGKQNTKERFIPGHVKHDWQQDKVDFLKPYKFAIAFENVSYPGYTTEKIYHPMLANSIPIYFGNPLIQKDFNTKSFLNYHDFERQVTSRVPKFLLKIKSLKYLIKKIYIEPKAIKLLIKKIIEIDNNDALYEAYLKQPWYHDNKPSEFVNDKKVEEMLIEIVETGRKKSQ